MDKPSSLIVFLTIPAHLRECHVHARRHTDKQWGNTFLNAGAGTFMCRVIASGQGPAELTETLENYTPYRLGISLNILRIESHYAIIRQLLPMF